MNSDHDRLFNRYNEQLKASKQIDNNKKQTTSSLKCEHEKLDPELKALVLDLAPNPVKRLVENIKNYAQNPDNCTMPSSAIFTGIPGSGKTTIVQAIAEDANVDFIMLKAPYTADQLKNSGPEQLREFFDIFMNIEKPTLVAIDEFHRYTDGYKKINEPDPGTAETFWLLMDDCKKNKNLIIIGITNDCSDMAPQIESRFGNRIYEIKPTNENIFRQRVLHYCLSKNKVPNNCDQKCEKTIASLIEFNDVRIIQDLVISASEIATERKEKIKQKDLEQSIKEYGTNKKLIEKKKEEPSVRSLSNLEKAGISTGIACGVAVAANNLDQVAQRHGGWKNFCEEKIIPIVKFFSGIVK